MAAEYIQTYKVFKDESSTERDAILDVKNFYENYIKQKIEIFMFNSEAGKQEHAGNKQQMQSSNMEKYAITAYSYVAAKQLCGSIHELCNDLENLLNEDRLYRYIGLTDEHDQFSHRNFVDYFFAIFNLKQLCKTNAGVLLTKEFYDFFWKHILIDPSYCGVRRLLNGQ